MTVTFVGHSKLQKNEKLLAWLEETIVNLIEEGATQFLLGGYGDFDTISAKMVKKVQDTYPHIESYLVIPYLDRKYDTSLYNNTIYPPLETVPKRFAISKRNEWMVDDSDVVVAYLLNYAGGSGRTMEYAERRNKKIILYQKEND